MKYNNIINSHIKIIYLNTTADLVIEKSLFEGKKPSQIPRTFQIRCNLLPSNNHNDSFDIVRENPVGLNLIRSLDQRGYAPTAHVAN